MWVGNYKCAFISLLGQEKDMKNFSNAAINADENEKASY